MDVLTLGQKNYVKASVIARELGYTADYVGQLCRSGKVDAKLVGRSWYVFKDSIHDHKRTRYRSTQNKSIEDLKNTIRVDDNEPVRFSHFYTHHGKRNKTVYEQDKSELLPSIADKSRQKTGKLNVELADASEINVKESDSNYVITTPQLPKIKFHGMLRVSELSDETEAESKTAEVIDPNKYHVHPKEVLKLKSEKMANKLAISDIPEETGKAILINEATSLPTPISFSEKLKAYSEIQPADPDMLQEEVESIKFFTFSVLTVSIVFAFFALTLLFGLVTFVQYSAGSPTTFFVRFSTEKLFSTLYSIFESKNILVLVHKFWS